MTNHPALEKTIEIITHLMAEMEAQMIDNERFSELSMRQVLYLHTILHMRHPTFSDLARQLNVTKPSVTAIVGKLIAMGYVQKVQDDEDRRSFHIVITPKGEQYGRLHEDMHRQVAHFLSAQLNPDEVEQLTVLLQKAVQGRGA